MASKLGENNSITASSSRNLLGGEGTVTARDVFKQLYKEPKVFKSKDYAPLKHQFTIARKELAAFAYLCRQQEAREWLEYVLQTKFPENPEPKKDDELMKRSYKSDLFPVLRDGQALCKVMNLVKQGAISKIAPSTGKPFLMLENINFFLDACKAINVPDHKSFSPLDLLERKNMPKVVYCIHQFAQIAFEQFRIGRKIGERNEASSYHFEPEELEKAGKDLEESENAKPPAKSASPSTSSLDLSYANLKKVVKEDYDQHNQAEIERNRCTYSLNQTKPAEVIIEGSSMSENVDGESDNNYAICVDVSFTDGSALVKQHFAPFSVGTHGWEDKIINLNFPDKCIKDVLVYPEFKEHYGKVWFDRFGCFENKPPSNLIQFVQNPSFESADEGGEKLAAYWEAEGDGYLRTSDEHTQSGEFSIQMTGGKKSVAFNNVTIFQTEPAPIIVEGWSKADGVELEEGGKYQIVAEVTYDDDSKSEVHSGSFSSGTHDWERKSFGIDPKDKPIKSVALRVQFEGGKGTVYFDHVTICQEEFKQYVKNPSFESLTDTQDVANSQANDWNAIGKYNVHQKDWCLYGHTSVAVDRNEEGAKREADGVEQKVTLNQKKANQVTVSGWSKAEGVTGEPDKDFALVADVVFTDGSKKNGEFVAFATGTHDWEKSTFNLNYTKPIAEITLRASMGGNHYGKAFFDNLTIEEEFQFGESEVYIVQKLLMSLVDDKDGLDDIMELKRRVLVELRKNHTIEKTLQSIESRIGLLIKNRIDVQELVQESKRFFRLFKKNRKREIGVSSQGATIDYIKKNSSHYQGLFYLLQTEPKYLAKIVTFVSPSDMESFLETVILTLFGDVYSPREEFLLLQVLNQATYNEMVSFKDISGFLEANTVTARMIVTYNRRELGKEYLIKTLGPVLQKVVLVQDLDLETSALKAANQLITDQEVSTGEKSAAARPSTEEEALKIQNVEELVNKRVSQLVEICDQFLDVIISSIEQLPYGLRWICKQIVYIGKHRFEDGQPLSVQKIIGYFVYYRFINPAIVSPDLYGILRLNLNNLQRKNVVQVSKILQSLFNFAKFDDVKQPHLKPVNSWIDSNKNRLIKYLEKLVDVAEPQDHLMVDNYLELTHGTKPHVIMTYDEIYSTHEVLVKNLAQLCDKEDPLAKVVEKLGALPEYDLVDEDLEREFQLTLQNPFVEQAATARLEGQEEMSLPLQTRNLFIEFLRNLEPDNNWTTLWDLFTHVKKSNKKSEVISKLVDAISKNLDELESLSKQDKPTICAKLMEEISSHVANQAALKLARKNIITRLRLALDNLFKNQKWMNDQMESYNTYLEVARFQQASKKLKNVKKQTKGKKLSYSELKKAGVIVDSSVPEKVRKTCSFVIARGENPNEFHVKAKIAGVTADSMLILFDELLEKQANGIHNLELDNVTLDVNMTVSFINRHFLQKS
eukprot:TRINITY_DN2357_c0_g1_i1.p1 TRINITY_DN2357_c0_g1~~TRINITY_DN2357_c0_g1_i1.p1  ORF type:complete len:1438 (-),score=655.21 TRINITY_DN2357_c0_g1_i1:71-4384(-)